MAYCEECGKTGYTPNDMLVNQEKKIFIGPCCQRDVPVPKAIGPQPPPGEMRVIHLPKNTDDVEFGMEISNKIGVRAYVNYSGLQLSFERSPSEIQKWAKEQGFIESA
jgi:hypothetical protein